MAKHKHREQDPVMKENNTNAVNNKNIPFGIDPMQLMGLLGGNFDINSMGNMLASMNTNGFNFGNLNSIAKMMGLNLDNNLFQGNTNNTDNNKNMYSNTTQSMNDMGNMTSKGNMSNNITQKNMDNSDSERNVKKNVSNKNNKENDVELEFLIALRNYVHPDRIRFIDKIIEAYKRGDLNEI